MSRFLPGGRIRPRGGLILPGRRSFWPRIRNRRARSRPSAASRIHRALRIRDSTVWTHSDSSPPAGRQPMFAGRRCRTSRSKRKMRQTPRVKSQNYLFEALITQLQQQLLQWHLMVTVAQPADPTNDATLPWPVDRQQLDVGTLTLEHAQSEDGDACRDINFDPLVLPSGIEPSDDPLLSARSAVYSRSFTLRAGETKPPSAVQIPSSSTGERSSSRRLDSRWRRACCTGAWRQWCQTGITDSSRFTGLLVSRSWCRPSCRRNLRCTPLCGDCTRSWPTYSSRLLLHISARPSCMRGFTGMTSLPAGPLAHLLRKQRIIRCAAPRRPRPVPATTQMI